MTPIWLGLLGLALALPVPALLARSTWPLRAPRAGIVMWQSLAVAAILATSGAGLSTALWLVSVDDPSPWRVVLHVAVLGVGVLVWARFWWAAWTVWRRTGERRRRQRHLVDLLGEPDGAEPALRVLRHETPIAYCLPDRTKARVVVSSGTIDLLDEDGLRAVLEHERSHVRSRHDLVLEGFEFLRAAYPRFLRTDAPLHQSQVMVELLADDAARQVGGVKPVAKALVTLADAPTPAGALGVGSAAAVRLERLRDPDPSNRLVAASLYLFSAAVVVVPTVAIAIPWMVHAWQVLLER
ncbi:M56 family metallopeptidase [Aeromicrobium sp. IC_218]|uniref:M56 family metallopeptidase n=1 Tax=Aeromicrobium sp. IC_218 TaxID=2545468 RepID=UPI001039BD5D|nr:M56 family metallopeptidase [Aeromicrobium sp. IC_218]TCJ00323.1 M56 family peptidase [Aeromicrobium sp. IC_218]